MGLRVPQDVSIFCANVEKGDYSGLRRDYRGMGRAATEMTSILLESGDLGLKGSPRGWQVGEFWQAGKTLNLSIAKCISREGFLLSTLQPRNPA